MKQTRKHVMKNIDSDTGFRPVGKCTQDDINETERQMQAVDDDLNDKIEAVSNVDEDAAIKECDEKYIDNPFQQMAKKDEK